jgi:hypothetical protein
VKFPLAILLFAFALLGSSRVSASPVSSHSSRKVRLFRHQRVVAWKCDSSTVQAFVYQAGMAVDADGAFRAYHPNHKLGLDSIEHAGHPGNWWALATDTGKPSGRPIVQGENDPAPGYYVSITSLFDPGIPSERNPRRFVDAAKIPYIVLPREGLKHAKLGDFATVTNLKNGRVAGAIVADESVPESKMGEGSIALAVALDIDSNPRTGGAGGGVAYVIYPGSGNGKPRTLEEINSISQRDFLEWGGWGKLNGCLR